MDKNVNLIVEKLKKIPCCEGIIYAGSRVEGDFTADSDYDFTVLTSKGKSYYKTFRYKGLLVDICCATAEVIARQDFNQDDVENAELSILANGEIVFDKSGQISAIQKKAKKIWASGPKKFTKNDFKISGYLCTAFLHMLDKTNNTQAWGAWNLTMYKSTKLFFALHNAWLPKPSQIENKIKQFDQKFFKLYKKVYQSDPTGRVKTAQQMIKYLIKKFNLPETGEMRIPKGANN